jgi:glycosyltransferase involved in cell wall biosynthesis
LKKIFIISSSLRGGGAERVSLNLYDYFSSIGQEVELIIFQKDGAYLDLIEDQKITFLNKDSARSALPNLIRLIKTNPESIFLSTKREINIVMGIAKFFSMESKVKLIFREVNPLIYNNFFQRLISLIFIKFSYSFATHIIANSTGTKKSLLVNYICTKSKVSVIGNPVLSQEVIKSNPLEDELIIDNENTIICAGRLEKQKNFRLAIDILHSLNCMQNNKKFKLVIYGMGSEREKLEEYIEKRGLINSVSMPGFSFDLLEDIKPGSLFLLTSSFEGFGNVIVEALFCGLPICAKFSDGGVKDILENKDFVKVIDSPNNSPNDFLDGIVELSNINLTKSKKEEIRELSLDYSIENIGKKYLNSITSV